MPAVHDFVLRDYTVVCVDGTDLYVGTYTAVGAHDAIEAAKKTIQAGDDAEWSAAVKNNMARVSLRNAGRRTFS